MDIRNDAGSYFLWRKLTSLTDLCNAINIAFCPFPITVICAVVYGTKRPLIWPKQVWQVILNMFIA